MSNETAVPEPPPFFPFITPTLSAGQYNVCLGLLLGLTAETSISGIIATGIGLYNAAVLGITRKGVNWTAIIMTNFNIATLLYMISFFFNMFSLNESNCWGGQFAGNFVSHYFYLSFDAFILFKSYIISKYSNYVLVGTIAVCVNRAGWTILDLMKSGGPWNSEVNMCLYYQYPLSGLGYNSSDMIIDFFSTAVSTVFTYAQLKSNVSRIGAVILQENVVRSFAGLAINSFSMYVNLNWTDPFMVLSAYLIQSYAYTKSLNAEHFWLAERKKGASSGQKQKTTTTSHSAPHNSHTQPESKTMQSKTHQ
ncbi:hypothetical protein BDR26DRAFT_432365 [Obelidium mucronatum]|nr:hypothetical protein BDR26DRAFT_432365 [Obelidium mucronatum]